MEHAVEVRNLVVRRGTNDVLRGLSCTIAKGAVKAAFSKGINLSF